MKRFANNNRSPRSRQRGLSLVELMVALLIGLILTAGVISVYLTSKKSYNVDTGLAQVQENGRFALSFMEPVLRMAGYEGCTRASPENFLNGSVNGSYSDVAYNFSNPIQGYEYIGGAANTGVNGSYTVPSTIAADTSVTADWSPSIPTSISGEISGYAIPGSDILVTHE
ncbi:MAG TPA: prepilin-type N-terminal cleavage/methylation domain-containing protein, partial [Gammaproteobacteria bacterium]